MSAKRLQNYARWRRASGATFIEAGAEEVIVPALWSQDTFVEKAGGSEILAQMWTFPDKKGRDCCLIPEVTALFQEQCQALLERRRQRLLFYVARCYRYERPQAGRYREFTQLGFECLSIDPRDACTQSLKIVQGFLESVGVRYELDSMARRGLSYYLEGQGFELRCPELGAQRQVAGGGAYQEGAGFAIGAERLLLALKAQGNTADMAASKRTLDFD